MAALQRKTLPRLELFLGRLAVDRGLLSEEQLNVAVALQARLIAEGKPRPLGALLVAQGRLTYGQMQQLLQEQKAKALDYNRARKQDERLGQMLIRRSRVAPEHVNECLRIQAASVETGERAVPRLGNLLVQKGFATPHVIDQALSEQQTALIAAAGQQAEEPRTGATAASGESAEAAAPPAPAVTAFGKYRITRELGRGGMGVVYEAMDTSLDRRVALKMMLASPNADEQEMRQDEERFLREARLSAGLAKHPHIVGVYEGGIFEGQRYMAMEFVDGRPMSDLLEADPGVVRRHVSLLRDVALAVHHAHEQGIIHRDLKPQNVLIDTKGQPHVSDFGVAKSAARNAAVSLTASGMVVGTPSYMSPEQAQGLKSIDRRSDVWSLGVMLYEILTGQMPFHGETAVDILVRIINDPVEPPATRRRRGTSGHAKRPSRKVSGPPEPHPATEKAIDNICLKALAKRPRDRYADAKAFADDLGRWLGGEAVNVVPPRHPRKLSVRHYAAAALLLVGATSAVFWLWRPGPAQARNRVAEAERWMKDGRFDDAFAAYSQALAHDPDNPAALQGKASAQRQRDAAAEAGMEKQAADQAAATAQALEEARLAAEAREKQAAEQAAAAAQTIEEARLAAKATDRHAAEQAAVSARILEKARLVQNVFNRWALLAGTLRELETLFYDDTLIPEEKRKKGDGLWPPLVEFMRETPPDTASQAAMKALAGWARRLAGYEDEGLHWMAESREHDPDVPYGALMEALTLFSAYVEEMPMPAVMAFSDGMRVAPSDRESPRIRALRIQLTARLTDARAARLFGEGVAEDFRSVVEGLIAHQSGLYENAESLFSQTLGTLTSPGVRSDILFARARDRFLLQRFDDALADLAAISAARPRQAVIYYYQARIHYAPLAGVERITKSGVQTIEPVMEKLSAALALNPSHGDSLRLRGIIQSRTGHFSAALADAEKALQVEPHHAVSWFVRGYVRWKASSDREGALADYTGALAIDPASIMALGNRGLLLSEKGDFKGAIADYTAALQIDPDNPYILVSRGNARRALGDWDEAVADATAALTSRPGYTQALISRGAALACKGKREAASADWEEARKQDVRNVDALLDRAVAWYKIGDFDAAAADLAKGLEIDPGHVASLVTRSAVRNEKHDYDGAITDATEALRLEPDHMQAYFNRGAARAGRGDPRGAAADFADVVRLSPRHIDGYLNLAEVYWRNRDFEQAIANATKALALDPGNVVALHKRGLAKLNRDDFAGALADYTEVLKLQPGDTKALVNRAAARLGQGDYPAAASDCTEALNGDASVAPWAHWYRARALREQGKAPEAIQDIAKALKAAAPDWPLRQEAENMLERLSKNR